MLKFLIVFQPFESFEIIVTRLSIRLGFFNFYLINSSLTLFIILGLIGIFFRAVIREKFVLVGFKRYVANSIILFAISQIKNQVGHQVTPWMSLFVMYFFLILIFDYAGLLPFQLTLTSHFNYVLIPTASIFLGLTIRVFTDNLRPFLAHFVPAGIPKLIGIFLFGIEIISYLFRAISLPVRVFANMVAGHVLLFLMATALAINYEFLGDLSLKISLFFILFIWFAVFHLELLVAYLQAYVFLTMISIYAKDLGKNRHLHRFRPIRTTFRWIRRGINFIQEQLSSIMDAGLRGLGVYEGVGEDIERRNRKYGHKGLYGLGGDG